jgi:hypothetical protein
MELRGENSQAALNLDNMEAAGLLRRREGLSERAYMRWCM